MAECADLKLLFPGRSLRCATEEFSAFLVQFLNGAEDNMQYRWWLSLQESHARFSISEEQRQAWLGLMNETLISEVDNEETRVGLQSLFATAASYIVGSAESAIVQPELQDSWNQQLLLEKLVVEIKLGNEDGAISFAQGFANRRSVFVGCLARMLKIGTPRFIEFALERINADPQLKTTRFNGRSLIHFAASEACLPIVAELLNLGVDPNVTDNGGYPPLYRAAGTSRDPDGVDVVSALIDAGATVNYAGGSSKSTPLHAAARHGNDRIAERLLAAGASPAIVDKKGHSPLDRAINCRKTSVVKIIEAAAKHDSRFTESRKV